MSLLSKLLGWDETQRQLDRMQEAGHQAEEPSYSFVTTCTNCGAEMDEGDVFCGQCGTYGCTVTRMEVPIED